MMLCGFPSSNTVKALRSSVVTMCCLSSMTEACSRTSSTSLRKTKTPWSLRSLSGLSFFGCVCRGADGVADEGAEVEDGEVEGDVAGLVSCGGAVDCDQAGIAIRTTVPISNVKRRTLATLFRRRVISRPGIHP